MPEPPPVDNVEEEVEVVSFDRAPGWQDVPYEELLPVPKTLLSNTPRLELSSPLEMVSPVSTVFPMFKPERWLSSLAVFDVWP